MSMMMFLHAHNTLLLTQFVSLILLSFAIWHLSGNLARLLAVMVIAAQTVTQLQYLRLSEDVYLWNAFLWAPGFASAFIFTYFSQKREELLLDRQRLESRLKSTIRDRDELNKSQEDLRQQLDLLGSTNPKDPAIPTRIYEDLSAAALNSDTPDFNALCEAVSTAFLARHVWMYQRSNDGFRLFGANSAYRSLDSLSVEVLGEDSVTVKKLCAYEGAVLNSSEAPDLSFMLGKCLRNQKQEPIGLIFLDQVVFQSLTESRLIELQCVCLLLESLMHKSGQSEA